MQPSLNLNSTERAKKNAAVEDAYSRWAPIYDQVFNLILRPGRKMAAQAVNRVGSGIHVLDVGIGTGLELPMFNRDIRLTGIDLSDPMLEIARKRVNQLGLKNVEALLAMDATTLRFPDASFGAVVAPYVVTVVPEPERVLDEIARVTEPGGEIVLVNHVAAQKGPIAVVENLLGKHADKLGWQPTFPWSTIGNWIARRPDITMLERRTVAPLGLFTVVRLRRS